MSIGVKICGIRDREALQAAMESGASYVGFVFYPSSKRYIRPEEAATLVAEVPRSIKRVGLFVDPDDDTLRNALQHVPLDLLQLHGKETPGRIAKLRSLLNLPVMKAIALAGPEDLQPVAAYEEIADRLLFDTRIGESFGGSGQSFDWKIMQTRNFKKPWMLAGGLNVGNLAEAVQVTGARIVDVSSGVEDVPGQKSPAKIREFIALAKTLSVGML
ncbi:MAG: phosphoribosylanthranilate isomerase [Alphaproteobacteria bacterium]|nr:phosphoribosylanthranilate isomerase [Alphaproteobacteria bacterium]